MGHEIKLANIGPVQELSFKLDSYGVTILQGANGCGKSSVLSAIQHAALGSGKLPLRDGARRGMVDALGAVITVGATTRYAGEFQVQHLESKLPLATLVDPGMKSVEAADKQRIKALVALTGVEANRSLFTNNPLFADFGEVVSDESTATTDLVEMASRVKRDYEGKAREQEKQADIEDGHARGMEEASEGLNLDAECDADQLQSEYNEARDRITRYDEQLEANATAKERRVAAEMELAGLEALYEGKDAETAAAEYSVAVGRMDQQQQLVTELRERLAAEQAVLEKLMVDANTAKIERQRAFEHDSSVRTLTETIATLSSAKAVELKDYENAAKRLAEATTAMELGVKIRDAKRKIREAQTHKQLADAARAKAEQLRTAAKAVDEVLSDAIQCDRLRVEIWDGQARLVTDHPVRGESVPYSELSEGERWRLALELGIGRVGEGGLLVVEQSAWEGLDTYVRSDIHSWAVERKCYVLTAEATRDPAEGRELKAKQFAMEA